MRADLGLKQKPSMWENPRNIALLVAAAIAGTLGFKVGQNSPPAGPSVTIIVPPGTTIQVPPLAAK